MSLYEYLGRAAGSNLGNQVYKKSLELSIKTTTRTVSNPKYSGKIMMYPKEFLDAYFSNKIENQPIHDNLPF
jgi:hypothetical protein